MKTTIDARCLALGVINIVSISGGKDSLAQSLRAIESGVQHLNVFADTGHEHPETMEYLEYLEQKLGPVKRVKADFTRQIEGKRKFIATRWPVTLVEECGMTPEEAAERVAQALEILHPTGIPFLDLCMLKGRFPSTKARFCSTELKHHPIRDGVVLPALEEFEEVILWQDVRAQESPARANLSEWERLVAACSRRGNSTFFPTTHDPRRAEKRIELITVNAYGIESYRDWAMTTHGGAQFDLLAESNDKTVCSSVYAGVCE